MTREIVVGRQKEGRCLVSLSPAKAKRLRVAKEDRLPRPTRSSTGSKVVDGQKVDRRAPPTPLTLSRVGVISPPATQVEYAATVGQRRRAAAPKHSRAGRDRDGVCRWSDEPSGRGRPEKAGPPRPPRPCAGMEIVAAATEVDQSAASSKNRTGKVILPPVRRRTRRPRPANTKRKPPHPHTSSCGRWKLPLAMKVDQMAADGKRR